MSDEKYANIARLMTSYNFEIEELPDKLKCAKCKLVLKDACQVPCSCTFCRTCINDMIVSGGEFCPGVSGICRKSILSRSEVDYRANIEILKLSAKCPHNECVLKFKLANMEAHIRECPKRNVECPFQELGCTQDKFLAEDLNGHLQQESRRHSEILIGMIADIDRKLQCSNREIEILTQRDESNRDEIEILKQRDESNMNEIEILKQRGESDRREIEMLKTELVLKNEEIRTLTDQIMQVENQNESIRKAVKSIKQEKADLTDRMRIVSEKIEHEIKERTESSTSNSATMIEHVDNEILAVTRKIGSNKDELCTKIESLRTGIQSINQGTHLMKGDIGPMKSHVQSIQALVGQVDASCEWLIDENVGTRSWDSGHKTSDCFHGERRPYKYQLQSSNGNGGLWIWLRICGGERDEQIAWPFEGRVVVTVADRTRRDACRSISKQCIIDRPSNSDGNMSDYFKFQHSELIASKLDLGRGVCVTCVIVSCAGR